MQTMAAAISLNAIGKRILSVFFVFAALFLLSLVPEPAKAASLYKNSKYAAIVLDADTGEVLYERNADAARHPASITKVMTLYLTFRELDTGQLNLTDRVYFSRHAASQPPSKLGIGQGGWISVEQAIRLLTTKSANDVAVALAERIGGTEIGFARRMTEQARALGMSSTAFYNASGLPNPAHSTTARDLTKLSKAIIDDFPHYYAFFSQQSYNFYGKRFKNHNKLLGKLVGLDGIKTGYTRASGFTLAASAVRDGKRVIAIVLGAPSSKARNDNIATLINNGFYVLNSRKVGRRTTIAQQMNEPDMRLDLWGPEVFGQGSGESENREAFDARFDETSNVIAPPWMSGFYQPNLFFQSYAWLR